MAQDKIDVTQDHIDAINKVIDLIGSARHLAQFLSVSRSNVYLWLNGRQLIPIKHAELLQEAFPEHIDVLTLRPDIKQYFKYFK